MTHPDGTRDCSACGKRLPLEEFWFSKRATNRRQYRCKSCHGLYIKRWIEVNGERRKQITASYERRVARYRRHSITEEEYEILYAAQGGVCAICRKPESVIMRGKVSSLHIDHDHATGCIRGLLCSACNTGLGKFRDDPTLLILAIWYCITSRELIVQSSPSESLVTTRSEGVGLRDR